MAKLNNHYLKLKAGYLFPEIARRVNLFTDNNPDGAKQIIRCGIGDVTEPLPLAAREAMKAAIDQFGRLNILLIRQLAISCIYRKAQCKRLQDCD